MNSNTSVVEWFLASGVVVVALVTLYTRLLPLAAGAWEQVFEKLPR